MLWCKPRTSVALAWRVCQEASWLLKDVYSELTTSGKICDKTKDQIILFFQDFDEYMRLQSKAAGCSTYLDKNGKCRLTSNGKLGGL